MERCRVGPLFENEIPLKEGKNIMFVGRDVVGLFYDVQGQGPRDLIFIYGLMMTYEVC